MRKIVWAIVFVSFFQNAALAVDLSGRLGIGPSLLSFTDGTGRAESEQILNGYLRFTMPFESTKSRLMTFLKSEEKLVITPYRESEARVDFTQELGDKPERPASYNIYGLLSRYDDKVFNYADNGTNRFGGKLQSSPIEQLNLVLGIDRYHRAVSEDKNGFDTQSINFGYDYEFLSKEDTLDGSLTMFQQNHKTDTFDYGQNKFNLGYKHLFSRDTDLKLRWDYDQVRYNLTGMKGADLNQNKLSAAWSAAGLNRWYKIYGYFKQDSFPNAGAINYNTFNIGLLLNRDVIDRDGDVRNRHDFTYYAYKDPAPKYFDYSWNFIRNKPWEKSLNMYFDNTVYIRRFQNTATVKRQSFYDDQFSAGVTYACWEHGFLQAGPLVGVRLWDDPNRGTNANPDDNNLFKNPLNYYIYGVKGNANLEMGPDSEISLGVVYRNFVNCTAKPRQTGNEELILDARYTQKIAPDWFLTATTNVGQQINDLGNQSSGQYYRNIMVRFEYLFGLNPTSGDNDVAQAQAKDLKRAEIQSAGQTEQVLDEAEDLIGHLALLEQRFMIYYDYFMRVVQQGAGIFAPAASPVSSSPTFAAQIDTALAYSFVQAEKKLAVLDSFLVNIDIVETALKDYNQKDDRYTKAIKKLQTVKRAVFGSDGLADKFGEMQSMV
ncbi:MAG: hypothetical protein V1653_05370, partial [bacterium]